VSTVPFTPAATASSNAAAVRYFLLRRLHSLTGILFGGYLMVHLIVNATMIEGNDSFANQVNKIHSLPFLNAIEWTFIYLPLIFHSVYGIWITFAGRPNVFDYPYGKNVYYTLQRISAIIILGFVLFHVLGMKGWFGPTLEFEYGPGQAAASTARHINSHWVVAWVVYPLGVFASCFHLANGFWTAAISWGLAVSAKAQKRWGWVCAAIFVFSFGCGMTAWVAALRLKGTPVPHL
jgi:succinate dehydrogenase / fumarate reductase cytochrome b subunit